MPIQSPFRYTTLLLAALAVATPVAFTNPAFISRAVAAEPAVSRITVTGEGRINLAPDIATLDM